MIRAIITDINTASDQVVLTYRIVDATGYGLVSGSMFLETTDTPDTIQKRLSAIIDKRNFVESLKPMIKTEVLSAMPAPTPVTVDPSTTVDIKPPAIP